jgi:hypothetical protein
LISLSPQTHETYRRHPSQAEPACASSAPPRRPKSPGWTYTTRIPTSPSMGRRFAFQQTHPQHTGSGLIVAAQIQPRRRVDRNQLHPARDSRRGTSTSHGILPAALPNRTLTCALSESPSPHEPTVVGALRPYGRRRHGICPQTFQNLRHQPTQKGAPQSQAEPMT